MEYTTGALGVVVLVGGERLESAGWAAPAAVAPAMVPRALVLPALVAGRALSLPLARAAVAVVGGALARRALGRVRPAVAALALGRRRAEVGIAAGAG